MKVPAHHPRQIFTFLVFGLLSCPSQATVIYTQGSTPNTFSRSDEPSFGKRHADDFQLASADTVRAVTWQGVYFPSGVNPTDNFTIHFYNDGGGIPFGSPIASITVGDSVNRQDAGFTTSGFNLDVYNYTASLGAGIALAGSTSYWISIVNDTSAHSAEWGWVTEFPATPPFGQTHRSSDGGITWPEAFNETLTFSLDNQPIPEPGSIALLLSAAGLLLTRKRK